MGSEKKKTKDVLTKKGPEEKNLAQRTRQSKSFTSRETEGRQKRKESKAPWKAAWEKVNWLSNDRIFLLLERCEKDRKKGKRTAGGRRGESLKERTAKWEENERG